MALRLAPPPADRPELRLVPEGVYDLHGFLPWDGGDPGTGPALRLATAGTLSIHGREVRFRPWHGPDCGSGTGRWLSDGSLEIRCGTLSLYLTGAPAVTGSVVYENPGGRRLGCDRVGDPETALMFPASQDLCPMISVPAYLEGPLKVRPRPGGN